MNKSIFLIAVILIVSACGASPEGKHQSLFSKAVGITENEIKGVDEVLKLYGGRCTYAIGFTTDTDEGKKKYFKLTLSESVVVERRAKTPEMPSSNIAYLFCKNLDQKERQKYNEIHTVLVFENGHTVTYEFPISILDRVIQRMSVVNKVVNLIKEKRFEALKPMLNNTGYARYDKDQLIKGLVL